MPKYKKMKIRDMIIYTALANNILEEVFENHPDIVTRAITKFVKENEENAQVQEEDNPTDGL